MHSTPFDRKETASNTSLAVTRPGRGFYSPLWKENSMRCLIKFSFPNDRGNLAIGNQDFGDKMQRVLKEVKAEAAYFTAVDGRRGGYIISDLADATQIPVVAEPFFLWLNADVEITPVMTQEDLKKAMPKIETAVRNWHVEQEVMV
jgi:hypothetical protein